MEFIDESQKVIGRLNILVHYDPNVKILLNRRLCELVVWLCDIANRFCIPVWKRCEEVLPLCQLALKEFYRQLVLGETLVQSSSSQHFWKLREPGKMEKKTEGKTVKTEGKTVEYLHSCEGALKDWRSVTVLVDEPFYLRCDRIKHELKLLLDQKQRLCVEHSCLSADQQCVPVKFREGKVMNLPCTSQHWLKLSIIGAPHGAFMVQFILDLFWHMIQVNRSLLRSQGPDSHQMILGSRRWAIICCDIVLHQVYQKLSDERKRGLGSFVQCQEDCKLLLMKLRYVMDQGLGAELRQKSKHEKPTAEEMLHIHRHQVAEFVLHKLEDRFHVVSTYRVAPQRINSKAEFQFLPEYLNIEEKKVKSLRHIASGGFSAVYECSCLGESVATKHFEYIPPDTDLKDTFRNELISLYKLKHFHIVQLVGYYTPEEHRHALLIELMEKDLWQKITARLSSPAPEAKLSPYPLHVAVDILLQIARGMKYSHDSGVMHRDIKSKNVLVKRITSNCNSERIDLSEEGYAYVKLTDFGLSTRLLYPTSNVGTQFWKAPEVIGRDQQEYSKSADVYSFAITCSEIFTGEEPFRTKGRMTTDQLHEVLMQGERPSLAGCPPYLSDYIRRCWDSTPKNRPSFSDICVVLQHFKSVLMRPKSDAKAAVHYRIATEEDIIELVCHGGLFWATREALKNGIDEPSQELMGCSRIPKNLFLDCLRKWTYPAEASSSPDLGVDDSMGTEFASPSPGSILEGFENLCLVQYNWRDVLLNGLREVWQLVGDHYAAWASESHDFDNALPWFRKAADNGHPDAFGRLGVCYESGYGVNKDIEKAVEHYTIAADKKSTSACVCLGLICLDPERVSYWQKALQYQNTKGSSIWIIKIWIHIMASGTAGPVYENAVTKLFNMSIRREDLVGRQLLAGPLCSNIRLFVEALRTSARDKQRATKVIIVRNLSMEPEMAQKIEEAGGSEVLLKLFKESFEPDSKLFPRPLVQAFCNVNPIDHESVIQNFRQDQSDPSSGLTSEEIQKFYQVQDQLAAGPPSPRPLPQGSPE